MSLSLDSLKFSTLRRDLACMQAEIDAALSDPEESESDMHASKDAEQQLSHDMAEEDVVEVENTGDSDTGKDIRKPYVLSYP